MNGLTGNQALLAADKATKNYEGQSPLALLTIELISESKEKTLTPTELGKIYFYGTSAKTVNQWFSRVVSGW